MSGNITDMTLAYKLLIYNVIQLVRFSSFIRTSE